MLAIVAAKSSAFVRHAGAVTLSGGREGMAAGGSEPLESGGGAGIRGFFFPRPQARAQRPSRSTASPSSASLARCDARESFAIGHVVTGTSLYATATKIGR